MGYIWPADKLPGVKKRRCGHTIQLLKSPASKKATPRNSAGKQKLIESKIETREKRKSKEEVGGTKRRKVLGKEVAKYLDLEAEEERGSGKGDSDDDEIEVEEVATEDEEQGTEEDEDE